MQAGLKDGKDTSEKTNKVKQISSAPCFFNVDLLWLL